ncbi:Hpt domain-containing protein [Laspinema olomoucense]|uniref:Hpt domain-containing protein n=1 Tax=Laspinema olomoucense TaxID=3231600 RepID=UPI0021BB1797|nr:Hpt domain-containing protein [Laspinema sp. D3d]MCT7972648.1 Hpt domain-containing protein [Laspinema sp. D3d]
MAVNLDRLQEISGGDREFEREILQAFIEDAWVSLNLLKNFLTLNDYDAFSHQAHQLKGSSANMGIPMIQNIALELDTKGQQQNIQGTEPDLENIEKILHELEEYLSKI